MWELMLATEQLDIYMDEVNLKLEIRIKSDRDLVPLVIRMNHTDLTQLIYTLLEINRSFRGDIPFFIRKSCQAKPSQTAKKARCTPPLSRGSEPSCFFPSNVDPMFSFC